MVNAANPPPPQKKKERNVLRGRDEENARMRHGLVWYITDSAIAPQKNDLFCLTNVSWLLNTRKDAIEKDIH